MRGPKKTLPAMADDKVRVIKIGKEALYEFLREKIEEDLADFFEADPRKTTVHFEMDFGRGELIVCAGNAEDENGKPHALPKEIDFQRLFTVMPDTTATLYDSGRYKEYTKKELTALSANGQPND